MRAERFVGIALGEHDGAPIVVPAVKGPGLHRSDVRHSEPLLEDDLRIRVSEVRQIRSKLTMSGRVSDETMRAIEVAMAREARATQFERRFPTNEPQERAVRF